jgi:hypothetical protein
MTQEAFKAWWYNEGSQAPYTHHDCEEHTMRMCEIAWNAAVRAEQEPVAFMDADGNVSDNNDHKCFPIPLYTAPPRSTWVGLTKEEVLEFTRASWGVGVTASEFIRAIEAKLKDKNDVAQKTNS